MSGRTLPIHLLERLARGDAFERARLAAELGMTDAELDAALEQLAATGLVMTTSDRETVQLAEPIDWIAPDAVEAGLSRHARAALNTLVYAVELESTNRHLLERVPPPAGLADIAIAEYQHGGRGRRGRRWTMPPGAGLALSAAWRFDEKPADLSAVGLAVGAAARRAIRDAAGLEVGLKWPNDLIVANRKLGGILVELGTVRDGGCHVVAGIGINVAVPAAYLSAVASFRHGAIDLASAMAAPRATKSAGHAVPVAARRAPARVARAVLASALIERLVELFAAYTATGFAAYRDEWLRAHVLDGAFVELTTPAGVETGIVRGIEGDGALIVEGAGGARRRHISGDVTVRLAS